MRDSLSIVYPLCTILPFWLRQLRHSLNLSYDVANVLYTTNLAKYVYTWVNTILILTVSLLLQDGK